MPLHADVAVSRPGFTATATVTVGDAETLALLGPNGAGKSTIIEGLAGLLPLEGGRVVVDGHDVTGEPPERRRMGVVFQDGALFPHLSALDNVAFGARASRGARADARRTAEDLLARVAPGVPSSSRPGELSGGQRQRVALARALASSPRVLLLDEPLAAVDVSARGLLRALLRDEIAAFAGPCVLVTHDPVDAFTLADRIAILQEGTVAQVGTPAEIRRAPATRYAADLVGVNVFTGRLEPAGGGAGRLVTPEGAITVAWPEGVAHAPVAGVLATVRPSDVALHLERPSGSPRNILDGPIAELSVHGERVRARLASVPPVVAEVTLGSVERLGLREGGRVFASFKAVEATLVVPGVDPDAEPALGPGVADAPGTLER